MLLIPSLVLFSLGTQPPPNIVMIVSDDQGWTDYGFMGHPHIKTPNLDRLAAESLTFTHGYVPSSLCCPSLASLLCGKYPHQHGIVGNDPPGVPPGNYKSKEFIEGREQMNRMMDAQPTLPRLLATREYTSLQTGKWWQGDYRRGGFTHGMTAGDPKTGGRHGDKGLDIGRKTMQPIADFLAESKKSNKPYFIWYAPMLPHQPHNPPERLLQKYKPLTPSLHVAKYWAMCEWFDETCGELLAMTDKHGGETIVVYVTDNGWIQNPNKPRFDPRSKQSPYDMGLRTPIMLRWPGKVAAKKIETPVSSLDIHATLLAAVGIEKPSDTPGVNLLDETAVATRGPIFGECFLHTAKTLDDPAANLRWRWMVDGKNKLIVPDPTNEPDRKVELYDLGTDPHESNNLAAEKPDLVAKLNRKLNTWIDGEVAKTLK